ncbi:VacB/RNase II family 3'-5' exoribonuclease [Saccharophagus sp. K07]|nr:VacB/RNase II family 3'-5' exoribonuclease [Saccharophagus sp. K07]
MPLRLVSELIDSCPSWYDAPPQTAVGFSMLDQNSIAQLSQLKKEILASKDYAEGVVVGANGRFGFVKLDDGRTAFLNPERMQRVLPGDRIKVNVVKNDKNQLEAELEKLLNIGTQQFVGRYKIKGNNHFVQAEEQGARWLFIPPPLRKKCQENDWVLAELNKHPFDDGKASAKIVARLGSPTDDFIHHNIVTAQFGLHRFWSRDALAQTEEIAKGINIEKREDFSSLPFVTIDASTTSDMDDAIYVKTGENGWQLWVAIADPGHFVAPGTPVAKTARNFAQSVYLPGRSLSMLPEKLANESFSLLPNAGRPALLVRININSDGSIADYQFQFGKITSRGKLSYLDVGAFLQGENPSITDDDEVKKSLTEANKLAQVRLKYRQQHHLVYEEQLDYDFILNTKGQLESVQKRERNDAHRLIEEAMLCANICAGEFLAQHKTGVFTTHLGFRPERIGEVRAVIREDFGEEFNSEQINELQGHIDFIHLLQNSDEHRSLLAPLKRMMQNSEINTAAEPHLSMGVKHYATITSPIRRYVDLCNHWSIIQILDGKQPQQMPAKVLDELRETLQQGRQACRQLEQILVGQYLSNHIGLEGQGVIRIVTQQGFGVKLLETGFEGFVQIPKKVEKVFDAKRMTIQIGERHFALDDVITVRVTGVDLEKRRVQMSLPDGFPTDTSELDASDEVLAEQE